ncbi:MAG: DUF1858 domain-containing protein [Clostridia bacterium]|jgi:hypothetical protein|nr:DUF1858 domain-containing protein [Clostridia bacterium]
MDKKIDLSKSVYELCTEYPQIIDIMKELGFESITNPGMLNTAGRFMTIPKGAKMKNINMEQIKERFQREGFEIKE